jgi:hypothetical protein
MASDTLDHLSNSYRSELASQLDDDCYGASGDFDDQQIRDRLMEAIVERCNYHISGHSGIYEDFVPMSVAEHKYKPALTLSQAAGLIISVWRHKDRQVIEAAEMERRFTA